MGYQEQKPNKRDSQGGAQGMDGASIDRDQQPAGNDEKKPPPVPDHEQGREHVPDVQSHAEAADNRRTAEQAHHDERHGAPGGRPDDRVKDTVDEEADDSVNTSIEGPSADQPDERHDAPSEPMGTSGAS